MKEGFYTHDEIQTLLLGYKEFFPEIVKELRIIGTTYNNLPIYSICLYKELNINMLNTNTTKQTNLNNSSNSSSFSNFDQAEVQNSLNFEVNYTTERQIIDILKNDRPHFLITAGLRGSDYMSVSMAIFMLKYILYGYVHDDSYINYILENRILW